MGKLITKHFNRVINLPCCLMLHYFLMCLSLYFLTSKSNFFEPQIYYRFEIYFVLILNIMFPICFVLVNYCKHNANLLNFLLFFIEFFLILCFFTKNLLIFYISFEAILIPMYLIIGIEGIGVRKIKAAYLLFIYTIFGSFFLLFAITYIYLITNTFIYDVIKITNFTLYQQKILCFCFLIAFAVKIPCIPFHLWLPEAHVEAPTIGSIILASLILKLPGYGLIVFVKEWFPFSCFYYQKWILLNACISIIYSSLSAIRQIDLKKFIAYSSVAHMNLVILGIFSNKILGIFGAIYLMVGHAFVSTGLFFCIGCIYIRYHTKNYYYYGGLTQIMPIYSTVFFLCLLANVGFPCTCNFIGEIIILSNFVFTNKILELFCSTAVIFSAVYSIWMYHKVCFGALTRAIYWFCDFSFKEFVIAIYVIIHILLAGVSTKFIFIVPNVA